MANKLDAVTALRLETLITAPPARVFDLARSVDVHQESAAATRERAIAGVTRGLLELSDEVTWQAVHLGFRQTLTVRITTYDRPRHFQDIRISGAFKSMRHDHEFLAEPPGTRMVDRFIFASPFGSFFDRLVLAPCLLRFLRQRNQLLKKLAESGGWKKYLPS